MNLAFGVCTHQNAKIALVPMVGAWSPKPRFLGSIPSRRARERAIWLFAGLIRQKCRFKSCSRYGPKLQRFLQEGED